MRGRVAEWGAVAVLAIGLTTVISAPVLRTPSDRVFGMPIVGRQHDPFTVMARFGMPIALHTYAQPLTDVPGALAARGAGPVAAYNWLVLATFPLAALSAYALGRFLQLSFGSAAIAALLFAFAPVHIAHAAYHPHIAQTQWLPLYLLALWRCLDRATWQSAAVLMTAAGAVALSNFYGGFIAVVITPVAAGAWWWHRTRHGPRALRHLAVTVGSLGLIAVGAALYAWVAAPAVLEHRAALGFPVEDVRQYSARWWSYLLPPVAHPVAGRRSLLAFYDARLGAGLVEQQVSLGWGVIALSLAGVIAWVRRRHIEASPAPVLVAVAVMALACSVSPPLWLHSLAPMFRAYARFGVAAQLMLVLLAGLGAQSLWRSRARGARVAAVALVMLVMGEYAVSPAALSRDVLPTAAHRWLMDLPGRVYALDCAGATAASESVPWLSGGRIAVAQDNADDCLQPHLADPLAADGYTHVILPRQSRESRWFASHGVPDGLRMAAWFDEAIVFTVGASGAPVYTARMIGFSPREADDTATWRWMGGAASWVVINAGADLRSAVVDVELTAFAQARGLTIRLDERQTHALVVGVQKQVVRLGPFTLTPGRHVLVFEPHDPPDVADDAANGGDTRALSFSVGAWRWSLEGARP